MIFDAWSRRIVGYAISRSIDVRLTLAALNAAIEDRRPSPGCIHHSDRGSQYAAQAYRQALGRRTPYGVFTSYTAWLGIELSKTLRFSPPNQFTAAASCNIGRMVCADKSPPAAVMKMAAIMPTVGAKIWMREM